MAAWGDISSVQTTQLVSGEPRSAATTTYKPLAEGTDGTFQTLGAMRQAVLTGFSPEFSGYQDKFNKDAATNLSAGFDDQYATIGALYRFIRDRISYIDHPWHMQVVQDSKRTLLLGTGDCVSKSVCLSTLLASLGYLSRFVAQASTSDGFDHVYVEAARYGAGWLALDPTADGKGGRPSGDVGWTQRLTDGGFEMSYSIF